MTELDEMRAELSTRTFNNAYYFGVETWAQAADMTEAEWKNVPGSGKVSVAELRAVLARRGLHFRLSEAEHSAVPRLRSMHTAPCDGESIILFKNMASQAVCHIAFWRSGQPAYPGEEDPDEKGWWSYVRGSVSRERVDETGELLGWIPMPEEPFAMINEAYG